MALVVVQRSPQPNCRAFPSQTLRRKSPSGNSYRHAWCTSNHRKVAGEGWPGVRGPGFPPASAPRSPAGVRLEQTLAPRVKNSCKNSAPDSDRAPVHPAVCVGHRAGRAQGRAKLKRSGSPANGWFAEEAVCWRDGRLKIRSHRLRRPTQEEATWRQQGSWEYGLEIVRFLWPSW